MRTLLILAPIAIPLLGAVLYLLFGWRTGTRVVSAVSAAGILGAGIGLGVVVGSDGPLLGPFGLLRVDALGAYMVIVIGAVALIATAASPAWLACEIAAERATARTAQRHSLLVQLFLASMATAVITVNLGLLWAAIEATTIATAFLVGQRRTRAAVEAAWKYVVICSVGIAMALLGVVLLNGAGMHAGLGNDGLSWTALTDSAGQLDSGVTRIAIVLLVVGFGTKAGLIPLYAWLPDAHGQAPAPVSALMSGVLLSVAFYAILRIKAIADPAVGPAFTRNLLVVIALLSLLVAASLLLTQRDYKRMLAYSSIEHLSLVALGAAAGTRLALMAVLLHILGHGLGKSVLFVGSGQILQDIGTSRIENVRGLLVRRPVLAACFGLGILALIGIPPFSMFASTLGIATAAFAGGLAWPTTLALLLALVCAAAMLAHTSRMLLGPAPAGADAAAPGQVGSASRAGPLVIGLVVCAALGITLGPLGQLLPAAAATVIAP